MALRVVSFAEVPNFEPPSDRKITLAELEELIHANKKDAVAMVDSVQPARGNRSLASRKRRETKAERGPVARHARSYGGAFQRMCQRRDWASPVY